MVREPENWENWAWAIIVNCNVMSAVLLMYLKWGV